MQTSCQNKVTSQNINYYLYILENLFFLSKIFYLTAGVTMGGKKILVQPTGSLLNCLEQPNCARPTPYQELHLGLPDGQQEANHTRTIRFVPGYTLADNRLDVKNLELNSGTPFQDVHITSGNLCHSACLWPEN